jgi:hypothetical protein
MKTFKRALVLLAVCMLPVCMSARTEKETPAYRQKGYAGSVAMTDWLFVFGGLETSHGYMFNEHHYLGGGLDTYFVPIAIDCPIGYHFYADYKSYWFKKRSTPTAGIKIGYGGALLISKDYHSDAYAPYGNIKLEPNIGWDWGLKSGRGFTLSLGANILMGFTGIRMYALPLVKLSLGVTF